MNNMFRLIYISEIDTETFDSTMLKDILSTARKNNNKRNITGVLIFDYTHFLQVLEGDNDAVSQTFLKIAKDTRHNQIRIVSAYNASSRSFEHWDMEFKDLDAIVRDDSIKICDMTIQEIEVLLHNLKESNG